MLKTIIFLPRQARDTNIGKISAQKAREIHDALWLAQDGALKAAEAGGRDLAMVVDGKALGELFRDYNPTLDDAHGSEADFHALQDAAKVKLVARLGNNSSCFKHCGLTESRLFCIYC